MSSHENFVEPEVIPVDKNKILKIWKVAGILALVTGVEFIIAFTLHDKWTKIVIFIVLTLVKAYYIVSEFMHLGHERKALINSIILPLVLLFWLITVFLMESGFISLDILNWY
jgi:cytochrome c oxidase subunit IV